jgi:hypothetical protein
MYPPSSSSSSPSPGPPGSVVLQRQCSQNPTSASASGDGCPLGFGVHLSRSESVANLEGLFLPQRYPPPPPRRASLALSAKLASRGVSCIGLRGTRASPPLAAPNQATGIATSWRRVLLPLGPLGRKYCLAGYRTRNTENVKQKEGKRSGLGFLRPFIRISSTKSRLARATKCALGPSAPPMHLARHNSPSFTCHNFFQHRKAPLSIYQQEAISQQHG